MDSVRHFELFNELARFDPSLDVDTFNRFMMRPDVTGKTEPPVKVEAKNPDDLVRSAKDG